MELNEYQKRAMSTCLDSSRNYVYMAEGLVGEVGEFTSKVAKMVRKNQAIVSDNHLFISEETQEENMKGLKAELGDILWFVSGIAEVLGWDLDSVAQDNIKKLASRQKRNVIDGNGDNR